MRSTLLVVLVVLCVPRPAWAQDPVATVVGRHVRVTTFERPDVRWDGYAMSAGHDTLVLATRDSILHFTFASVAQLEVRRERRRWPIVLGMSVGAVAGVAAGISLAGTKCLRRSYIDPWCDSTTELLAPVAGAVVGAIVGGGVGMLVQKRWARVGVGVGIMIRRD